MGTPPLANRSMLEKERLYYMDWLRILAILFVFYVHSSMPFVTVRDVWLIQFDQTGMPFTMFAGFTYQWVMHLFFLLAGAGARLALASRASRQYLVERFQRLLIPFVFGSLAFTAFQDYVSLTSKSQPLGSFLQFYPRLYLDCLENSSLGLLRIDCLSSHLWFLGYLFLYSVLTLPLFEWVKGQVVANWIDRLAAFSQKPGGILVFFLPTALVQVALRARFPQHQNWSDFILWMIYFALGYVFLGDKRFLEAVVGHRIFALAAGLACMLAMSFLLLNLGYAETWEIQPAFSGGYALYQVLRSLNTWLWVIFFLGIGARHLEFNHPFLRYGREALLPFYILHQVVIVLLAFALFRWHPSILVKFLALSTGAFLSTIGLYELLIRRINGLRFLFGMRVSPRSMKNEITPQLDGRTG